MLPGSQEAISISKGHRAVLDISEASILKPCLGLSYCVIAA